MNVERDAVSARDALVFAQKQPDEVRPLVLLDALVVKARVHLVGRTSIARHAPLGAAQRAERLDALLNARVLQRRVLRERLREDALDVE